MLEIFKSNNISNFTSSFSFLHFLLWIVCYFSGIFVRVFLHFFFLHFCCWLIHFTLHYCSMNISWFLSSFYYIYIYQLFSNFQAGNTFEILEFVVKRLLLLILKCTCKGVMFCSMFLIKRVLSKWNIFVYILYIQYVGILYFSICLFYDFLWWKGTRSCLNWQNSWGESHHAMSNYGRPRVGKIPYHGDFDFVNLSTLSSGWQLYTLLSICIILQAVQ